jgi:hypothetical protein
MEEKNMTALTTTLIVAEELERRRKHVYALVKKYRKDFETFGPESVSNRRREDGKTEKFYYIK